MKNNPINDVSLNNSSPEIYCSERADVEPKFQARKRVPEWLFRGQNMLKVSNKNFYYGVIQIWMSRLLRSLVVTRRVVKTGLGQPSGILIKDEGNC